MSAITGIVAGMAAAAGAVALYRFAQRRARDVRVSIEKARGRRTRAAGEDAIIEFERDPVTGVYRAR